MGSRVEFSYVEQPKPEGLAQAFILGKDFIQNEPICLILGDNIFYGHGFTEVLTSAAKLQQGGLVFGYKVTRLFNFPNQLDLWVARQKLFTDDAEIGEGTRRN